MSIGKWIHELCICESGVKCLSLETEIWESNMEKARDRAPGTPVFKRFEAKEGPTNETWERSGQISREEPRDMWHPQNREGPVMSNAADNSDKGLKCKQ